MRIVPEHQDKSFLCIPHIIDPCISYILQNLRTAFPSISPFSLCPSSTHPLPTFHRFLLSYGHLLLTLFFYLLSSQALSLKTSPPLLKKTSTKTTKRRLQDQSSYSIRCYSSSPWSSTRSSDIFCKTYWGYTLCAHYLFASSDAMSIPHMAL